MQHVQFEGEATPIRASSSGTAFAQDVCSAQASRAMRPAKHVQGKDNKHTSRLAACNKRDDGKSRQPTCPCVAAVGAPRGHTSRRRPH